MFKIPIAIRTSIAVAITAKYACLVKTCLIESRHRDSQEGDVPKLKKNAAPVSQGIFKLQLFQSYCITTLYYEHRFQSEELTNQRRSYKCAPVEMKSEGVQEFKVLSWEPFLVGIICLMSLTFAAMATCYFTRRGKVLALLKLRIDIKIFFIQQVDNDRHP